MSEFSIEDDPDPLPERQNGMHYYDVHDFLNEIVRPDSHHTLQYREWYPMNDAAQGSENDSTDQVSTISEINVSVRRVGLLRRLGRFAHFAVFE